MSTRQQVYKAIDGERAYQDTRWNDSTTTTGGKHPVTEWLVYIQDYASEALHILSRESDPEGSPISEARLDGEGLWWTPDRGGPEEWTRVWPK